MTEPITENIIISNAPDPAGTPLLEVRGVSKRFPGVQALDRVSLTLGHGELLALIGENGAGKSTLMKVLAGINLPDGGQIVMDGAPVAINAVGDAIRLGISLIHQELNLATNLSVAANVFLGREPRRGGPLGLVDRRRMDAETRGVLDRLGLAVAPSTLVRALPIGQQQMVEIAKALSLKARVLIMDEPTSSLSQHETGQLFRVIRDLKAQGVSIIYISHRLGEVQELADRVTVLRDGRNAGDLRREEINRDRMVRLMVGREVSQFYHHETREPGRPVLETRGLRVPGRASHPINFTLRAGEIVGLSGLVGAGRTELAQVLFGIDAPLGGEIFIDGQPARFKGPRDAIRAGLALVPEDRKLHGLVLELAVGENIVLPGWPRYQSGGFVKKREAAGVAGTMKQRLGIKAAGLAQQAVFLSGGNQQKIVLGKWLALKPRVLLLDEPTRGIDVVAKEEIYRLIEGLAADGMAILMISSELQEILGISDRVLVMHEGRLAGELKREQFSEEAVMHLATGGGPQ